MKILITTILLLLIPLTVLYADEASHRAAIEEYLTITKVDSVMDPMYEGLEKMIDDIAKQMGISEEERPLFNSQMIKYFKMMKEELGWNYIKEDFIRIHQETFTEDEIRAFVAFYKSPAGQVYVEKTPLLMKKITEISQKHMPEVINKIQAFEEQMAKEIQNERDKKQTQDKK